MYLDPILQRSAIVLRTFVCLLVFLCLSASGQVLRIDSNPSGATLTIDDVVVGKTPYEVKVPGGYFHKTATAFGKRLGHASVATVSLDGYITKSFELTNGPWPWTDLNGHSHGDFYLYMTPSFLAKLDKVDGVFTTSLAAHTASATLVTTNSLLSLEDLIDRTSDAVLRVENVKSYGSGFLVTPNGIVVTNRHVVQESDTVVVKNLKGQSFNGSVVYRDPEADLALIRLDIRSTPSLPFADSSSMRVGQDVIAIGNPSHGMQNTVTRGIISGIGPDESLGAGVFLQTDAAINPGNSGGPLLNRNGEVVGMNTLKALHSASGVDLQSIGFAISTQTILAVLHKTFPQSAPAESHHDLNLTRVAKVEIRSNAADADVYLDGKFVGNVGSSITVPTGDHKLEVKSDKYRTWERTISVGGQDTLNVSATLQPN